MRIKKPDLILLRLSAGSPVLFSILIIIAGTFSLKCVDIGTTTTTIGTTNTTTTTTTPTTIDTSTTIKPTPCQSHDYSPLLIASGSLEIILVSVQTLFLGNLRHKTSPKNGKPSLAGRQHTMFSFLFNLNQWIFSAFQINKCASTLTAMKYFTHLPWSFAKSILMPISIFYRFHSAILSIELWKGVYRVKHEKDNRIF